MHIKTNKNNYFKISIFFLSLYFSFVPLLYYKWMELVGKEFLEDFEIS